MRAIETTGIIETSDFLKINRKFNKQFLNKKVRVLILFPDEEIEKTDEIDKELWLQSVSNNSVFDFLKESEENIYSLTDGKAFSYEV